MSFKVDKVYKFSTYLTPLHRCCLSNFTTVAYESRQRVCWSFTYGNNLDIFGHKKELTAYVWRIVYPPLRVWFSNLKSWMVICAITEFPIFPLLCRFYQAECQKYSPVLCGKGVVISLHSQRTKKRARWWSWSPFYCYIYYTRSWTGVVIDTK